MMRSESAPWDQIIVPSRGFNVRQVPTDLVVPCFWGRDRTGACLFIVELQGDHADQFRNNVVTMHGIDVDLRGDEAQRQHLVLTLGKQVDRDLFESLCHTLVSALEGAADSARALTVALAHLRRWKAFLSGRRQFLSPEEVRGLFAELTFLLELLQHLPSTPAVEAWLGPEKSHQDFIFGNTAVEVKSLLGSERNAVRISSEDQLESLNDNLFLRIYRLSNLPEAEGARSLNDIVRAVQEQFVEAESIEAFERKLVAQGFAPLPDYDQPRFIVSDIHSYRVSDGFPRLIRSHLPVGVSRVAYDVRLESIANYKCENGQTFGVK